MVGRALSNEKKRRLVLNATEKWEKKAIDAYKWERKRRLEPGERRHGWEVICRDMNSSCLRDDKIRIKLTASTMRRRYAGVQSRAERNRDYSSILTKEEENELVDFLVACSDRSFPLSHRRLEEHATEIAKAHWGEDFAGLGHNWTDRFMIRHQDRVRAVWSHTLDTNRAQGANPINKADYFKKLNEVQQGQGGDDVIRTGDTYAVDESGLQTGQGQKERVFGRVDARIQQQQRSGNKENITVIVSVCADGSSLPPAVVFKGQTFLTTWKQDNPLRASIGHSNKGWTTGEIGVDWIKHFDQQTKEKAGGRRRLLLVDGHSSHYTAGLLRYAQENRIEILCYPSHSTHLFQGLDVVIFSPLKLAYSRVRDDYEREHGPNIISAFRTTGVVPFNPDVITEQMLAPSLESSVNSGLLVAPDGPIAIISDLIHATVARQVRDSLQQDEVPTLEETSTGSQQTHPLATPVRRATQELSSSSASLLPNTVSPFREHYPHLRNFQPVTDREEMLWEALRDSESRDTRRKHEMIALQSQVVLEDIYVRKVRSQMQDGEKRKKKGRALCFGDGKAKLLTAHEYVQDAERRQREKDAEDANMRDTEAGFRNRTRPDAIVLFDFQACGEPITELVAQWGFTMTDRLTLHPNVFGACSRPHGREERLIGGNRLLLEPSRGPPPPIVSSQGGHWGDIALHSSFCSTEGEAGHDPIDQACAMELDARTAEKMRHLNFTLFHLPLCLIHNTFYRRAFKYPPAADIRFLEGVTNAEKQREGVLAISPFRVTSRRVDGEVSG
ncbi:hypothetical protein NMY22_g15390 [Coprinellus aureogranulatus]|nr:hypothetical protein NMY22_g15390 [Coprinellus aureogranulatus]